MTKLSNNSNSKNKTTILAPLLALLCLIILGSYFILISIASNSAKTSSDISEEAPDLIIKDIEVSEIIQHMPSNSYETHIKIHKGEILYISYGSSTCPPIIENATYIDEETIDLSSAQYDGMCTMDIAPTAQIISNEDGTSIKDKTTVLLDGSEHINQTISIEDLEWTGAGLKPLIHPYPQPPTVKE